MIKIVTVEQMRAIEKASDAAGHSYAQMMEWAGRGVAELVIERIAALEAPHVVILVGPGNNGGDGLVAGYVLDDETEAQVTFYLYKARNEDDVNFARVEALGSRVLLSEEDDDFAELRDLIRSADVVVDALLGTGTHLPVKGRMGALLEAVGDVLAEIKEEQTGFDLLATPARPIPPESTRPLVIAVDCPTGIDSDTGEADPAALHAHETVTFAAVKIGMVKFPGAAHVGALHVGDIGLPLGLPELDDAALTMPDGPYVAGLLPERGSDSHKGTFGKALIAAGSANYVGAAGLSGSAAYRVGAGLVTVGAPGPVIDAIAGHHLEITWLHLPHDLGVIAPGAVKIIKGEQVRYDAVLLGPGWPAEAPARRFLSAYLGAESNKIRMGFGAESGAPTNIADPDAGGVHPRLVIDAGGLNVLAKLNGWPEALPVGTILTPHAMEMARLSGLDLDDVLADRFGLAAEKAAEWGCVVVLKGAHTAIAAPDGRLAVLPFATSALATAGTGDALAGAITGLLAQGLEPYEAAVAGGYLHGLAGVLAAEKLGTEGGVTAGDVLNALPDALAILE